MNFQRVSALVKKDLKRLIREPSALFMIILFPIMLTLVFGLAFGGIGGNQTATYQIGLVNNNPRNQSLNWTQHFIGNLTSIEILKVQPYPDNATAQGDLIQGKISAIIIIHQIFRRAATPSRARRLTRTFGPTQPSKYTLTLAQCSQHKQYRP